MRWMASSGKVELYTRSPGIYRAQFTLASYARLRRVGVEGKRSARVLRVPPRYVAASVQLSLPRGRSSVELTAEPGAEGLPDGRQASVYVSNWRLSRATDRAGRFAVVAQAEPAP